ncbi:hypothetical protein ACPV47_24990, partial [Vibrio jasicida]
VATADPLTDTISYTPPAGFEGIERILFSYSNSTTGEVLLGTLDIAVSHSANQGLLVEEDIKHSEVEVNVETTIDVSPYVTSLDGDDYQLVYVDSFNAATEPASLSLTNKTFTFQTSQFGNHYVSFAVSDHSGALAMGLIEVPAFDPNQGAQWDDIDYQGLLFTAPLTTVEAVAESVAYDSKLEDTFYTPAVELALFDSSSAQSYCSTFGRLPTSSELVSLIGGSSGLQTTYNWPISAQYLAQDDGAIKTVDVTSEAV